MSAGKRTSNKWLVTLRAVDDFGAAGAILKAEVTAGNPYAAIEAAAKQLRIAHELGTGANYDVVSIQPEVTWHTPSEVRRVWGRSVV